MNLSRALGEGAKAAGMAPAWAGGVGREDKIRTCGLLLPKQALYQAELPPDPEQAAGYTA